MVNARPCRQNAASQRAPLRSPGVGLSHATAQSTGRFMDRATDRGNPPSVSSMRVGSESVAGDLRSAERKVRIGFAFALACLAVIGVVSYLSVVRLEETT